MSPSRWARYSTESIIRRTRRLTGRRDLSLRHSRLALPFAHTQNERGRGGERAGNKVRAGINVKACCASSGAAYTVLYGGISCSGCIVRPIQFFSGHDAVPRHTWEYAVVTFARYRYSKVALNGLTVIDTADRPASPRSVHY